MIPLNPKLFDADCEQVPIRKGYGLGLLEAGEKNRNVVALCAYLTESTQTHLFANKFPDRFIQTGIAEQNLASVASGMAAMGKIPFAASLVTEITISKSSKLNDSKAIGMKVASPSWYDDANGSF